MMMSGVLNLILLIELPLVGLMLGGKQLGGMVINPRKDHRSLSYLRLGGTMHGLYQFVSESC
jgi:hypothetical protein